MISVVRPGSQQTANLLDPLYSRLFVVSVAVLFTTRGEKTLLFLVAQEAGGHADPPRKLRDSHHRRLPLDIT